MFKPRPYTLSDGRTIIFDSGFSDGFEDLDNKMGKGFFIDEPYVYFEDYMGTYPIVFDNEGKIV